jgi:hypothetical protein
MYLLFFLRTIAFEESSSTKSLRPRTGWNWSIVADIRSVGRHFKCATRRVGCIAAPFAQKVDPATKVLQRWSVLPPVDSKALRTTGLMIRLLLQPSQQPATFLSPSIAITAATPIVFLHASDTEVVRTIAKNLIETKSSLPRI